MFCAEPGYLAGLLPPVAALSALLLCPPAPAEQADPHRASTVRRAAAPLAVVLALLGVFVVGPARWPGFTWLPTLQQIATRHARAEALVRWVTEGTRPGERVLVASDFTNNTVLRQLPLLRPGTECLFLHSARYEIFASTTISLASARGWRSAPGPSLLHPGPPTELATDSSYDWIVLDPRSSDAFFAEIAAQTACPVPHAATSDGAVHLRARACFPAGVIRLAPHALRFAAP
jgi:hypothetical protein